MTFLKSQGKGMIVGAFVVALWAFLDWFSAKHGLPLGRSARDYGETFFAATAGAGAVFYATALRTDPQ